MKYKKYSYLIVLALMLVIGINRTYADSEKMCYYMSGDNNFKVSIRIGYGFEKFNHQSSQIKFSKATIFKTNPGQTPFDSYSVENWYDDAKINKVNIARIYSSASEANSTPNPKCPEYVMYVSCPRWWPFGTSDKVFATDSNTVVANAINASSNCSYARYASNHKNGVQITDDMFFEEFNESGLIQYDPLKDEYTCANMNELFGDKNNPESIRYTIDEILQYVRIIVPILIIVLGMLDFAKAMISGKEDNMKKAQSTFVKRLIAGIAVFLVPVLVDIIMDLADIVWNGEYDHCDF